MKALYTGVSTLFFVVGLILSFQNIGFIAPVYIFFDTFNDALFYPLALMFLIGIGCGVFAGMALAQKQRKDESDDDF